MELKYWHVDEMAVGKLAFVKRRGLEILMRNCLTANTIQWFELKDGLLTSKDKNTKPWSDSNDLKLRSSKRQPDQEKGLNRAGTELWN